MPKNRVLHARITDETHENLVRVCSELGCSITEYVTDILEESPREKCLFELMPEVIEFCEKHPNSDVLNGDCAYFLDVRDKFALLASFLDERFP